MGVCPATGASTCCASGISLQQGNSEVCYTSQLKSGTVLTPQNFGNGINWIAGAAPFIGACNDASGIPQTVVVFGTCKMYPFTGSAPTYVRGAGVEVPVALSFDKGACVYRFTDCQGDQFEFDCYGNFLQVTLVSGTVVQSISNSPVSDVQSSVTDPNTGDTTVTSTLYTRYASGPNAGLVSSVLLRRQVNGGPWSSVRQTLYTYYGENDPSGLPGDLQTVVTQVLQGTCWVTTGTSYYRYYTASSSIGFAHGLKYVLSAEAFRRLSADPQVGDPLLAPDSLVAQYADNYYQRRALHVPLCLPGQRPDAVCRRLQHLDQLNHDHAPGRQHRDFLRQQRQRRDLARAEGGTEHLVRIPRVQ
jgi:hypothetical protein